MSSCLKCQGAGRVFTSAGYRDCDCQRILSRNWPWWMLAALMLTLGLSPAAWELFK